MNEVSDGNPNYAKNYEHKCLLDISRRHREAVDDSRVYDGKVIGQDNWDTLAVSTVFAAIAIEAALNDFVLSHCLFMERPYLQGVIGDVAKQYLRSAPIHKKLDLVHNHWPDPIPPALLTDVRRLIDIRNRITHQKPEFRPAETVVSRSLMTGLPGVPNTDLLHMLQHYEIAHDLLSRFWTPGAREMEIGMST